MNFTVSRDALLEALQKVQSVVEKKNTLHILSNVLLEVADQNLFLTATDLEVGIKLSIPVQASDDGKVAVSAKNFFEIVKELPNKPVSIHKKENSWIEISCQKSKFNIVGLAADEFPPLPAFDSGNYQQVNMATAREMIDRTVFAVSTDETRYHLNGAFLESLENNLLRMVATDGHRLAYIDKELVLNGADQFKRGIIIPKKGMAELRRLLDTKDDSFKMTVDKGNLLVKLEKALLFIRLIEGEYPDYEQVIPKNNTKRMTLNREEFLGSLKRVALLANEKSRNVKFSLKERVLTISSSNSDLGDAKEELDVEYGNDPIEIGFNAKYLIDCLTILDVDKVTIDLNDKLSPGLLKPFGRDDYTYIVMPMRI
ncbi:MAG: DNA polymerase III subunit beta [Deltaproteobacteria bacterium]|nr:DNA polymerase III subunit beta [Deltaproteobacteria bacterium]